MRSAADAWRQGWWLLVIAAVVVAAATASFWSPVLSLDEQTMIVSGDQVLAGRVAHRDFFATYGPANYWLVAGAFHLLGASVESQRLVGLLYHFAVGAGVYLCCFRRASTVALAAATTSVLFLIPLASVAYAWLGALAVLLLGLAVLQRATSPMMCAAAAAIGASCAWWRPEMLPGALLTALPFLLPGIVRALWYAMGVLVAVLPMVVFTIVAGPAWAANVLTRLGVDARYTDVDPYVVAGGLVVVALGAAMLVCGIRRGDRMCFSLVLLIAAAMPQLLQRPDVSHLMFVACATVPLSVAHVLPPVATSASQERLETQPSRLLRFEVMTWLASALCIAVGVGVVGLAEHRWTSVVHVVVGDRSLIADETTARPIRATVESLLRAAPDGPVFIGAQDMSQPTLTWQILYHLLPDSKVTAYYLEIPPGLDDAQAETLAGDVRRSQALLLTPFSDQDRKLLFPNIRPIPDDANVAVREDFCPASMTAYGPVFIRCQR